MTIQWNRRHKSGYECSTKGDKRFSALCALMPDGRTIEQWYQCDIKGFDPGGTNWRIGKGQPPKLAYTGDSLWQAYLTLWKVWAVNNVVLIKELAEAMPNHDNTLTDCFASSSINQARALATILNEWVIR